MDLFALGTPVIDVFAREDGKLIGKLGLRKGATNYFSAAELAKIERLAGKRLVHRYPGDNARNVCEGFAALGGFCGYQGAVGADRDGAAFAANLENCGIANFLSQKKGSTGRIIALVSPDGQRTFCADIGVSGRCAKEERVALANSRMLFLASITLCIDEPVAALAEKYLKMAKKQGRKIALSLESAPLVEKNKKKLLGIIRKYADVLFANEDEADALLGKGADGKLRTLKPGIPVYLKRGPHGSHLFLEGKSHLIPALSAQVIDTTGAGDAYAAGVLYGLSRRYTPLGSAKIGCMLATKVVQKLGAGIPHAHTRIMIRHGEK